MPYSPLFMNGSTGLNQLMFYVLLTLSLEKKGNITAQTCRKGSRFLCLEVESLGSIPKTCKFSGFN